MVTKVGEGNFKPSLPGVKNRLSALLTPGEPPVYYRTRAALGRRLLCLPSGAGAFVFSEYLMQSEFAGHLSCQKIGSGLALIALEDPLNVLHQPFKNIPTHRFVGLAV